MAINAGTKIADIEQILANNLSLYLFQNVWNEPGAEFRNNIVPIIVSERSIAGSIEISGAIYHFPVSHTPYYVYGASREVMQGIDWPKQISFDWISTEDLMNTHGVLLNVYHLTGKMMHKKYVYIRKLNFNAGFLIIVHKAMSDKFLTHENMRDIRFTVYYDSDINKSIIKTFKIPYKDTSFSERQKVLRYIAACNQGGSAGTTVYVNGYETIVSNVADIPADAYVDVVDDKDVCFSVDIDLTDSTQNFGFFSDMDKTYKQLVHIPKSANPENRVYTHNTMDIFIRTKVPDETNTVRGLYVHRCAERGVTQVTHNDIAIAMFVVDAYRDYLKTQDITLHVVVRQHSKDNILIRDKNYIDVLYSTSDQEIIDHLLGRIQPDDLFFWKAAHLEKSVYIQSMFDVPDVVTVENMHYYIEGLGYYHTMALVCKKIINTLVTNWFAGAYRFAKPYLYYGYSIYPLVYLNDKKVDNDYIVVRNNNTTSVDIGFVDDYPYSIGDTLTIEMFVNGNNSMYRMEVDKSNTFIYLPYEQFDIIEEISTAPIKTTGYDHEVTRGYTPLTQITGNVSVQKTEDGRTRVIFGSFLYGRTFIIQPAKRVYRWKQNIDDMLRRGDPVILDFDVLVQTYADKVPVWYTPTVIVYLNGKYLVRDIDFTVETVNDYNGNMAIKVLCIQNMQYLNSLTDGKTNVVEWFVTSAHEENLVSGFVVEDKLYPSTGFGLYFSEMTMAHADGVLETSVTNHGNCFDLPVGKHRVGAVAELRTSIPEDISNYLSRYHDNDDVDRMITLNNYFYGRRDGMPDVYVLDHSHYVYSIYVATIIRDLLNGNIRGLSYDPDIERMSDQVKPYSYLAETDLVKLGNLNLDFIDCFPHYDSTLTAPTAEMYKVLQAFIKLTMPVDPVTDKRDVNLVNP